MMKPLVILSIVLVHSYGECEYDSRYIGWKVFRCDQITPEESEFNKLHGKEKPLNFTRLYWENFTGELDPNTLKVLPNLSTFELKNSNFSTIPDGFFEACQDLEDIELRNNNNLKTIEENAFKNLTKLRNLFIINNSILEDFYLEFVSHCDQMENLGLPSDVVLSMDIPQLKEWFPKLYSISIVIYVEMEDSEKIMKKIEDVINQTELKIYFRDLNDCCSFINSYPE
ncbi:unnamed protein product [Brassicogethes aeneus]|uniref:Uncharacterized protein n=1 Tax=Brassicogethes aeneus TaxID=1431903 RepID=A0A9P0BM94_BRAAE|nr:unnamed protein product [Brassicogethes aeneus]